MDINSYFLGEDEMSNQSPSTDAQYLRMDNELRDLRQKLEKTRPAVYVLLFILFGVLGFVLPFGLAMLSWLFALAAVLTAITGASKRSKIRKQISDLESKLNSFQEPKEPGVQESISSSASQRLAELNKMLENKLITEVEYQSKKSQLLDEL